MFIDTKFLTEEFRRIQLMDALGVFIEQHISDEFWQPSMRGHSIEQFMIHEEADQVTTQVTAKVASLTVGFWRYQANEIFEETNSFLRIPTQRYEIKDDKVSYDLIFQEVLTGKLLAKIESKSGQSENTWRGCLSSSNKVHDFLLTKFIVDRNRELERGRPEPGILLGGIFSSIVRLEKGDWKSSSNTGSSHGTTFEFQNSERWNLEDLKNNSYLKGRLRAKRFPGRRNCKRWYAVEREPLNYNPAGEPFPVKESQVPDSYIADRLF